MGPLVWDEPVSQRSVNPLVVVLVEILKAGKENAHTEDVSVPVRINHCTFNGNKEPNKVNSHLRWLLGLPPKMVLYLEPFTGICYWSIGHLAVAIATSALVNLTSCCWNHSWPPSLLRWPTQSCVHHTSTEEVNDRVLGYVVSLSWRIFFDRY